MNLKSILALLLIINLFYVSSMDSDLSYDVTALHNAKLVVTAKILPGKGYKFNIVINNILKKTLGTTLSVGDKITILVPEFGSFGTKKRVYESEYILYLSPKDNNWILMYQEQHIRATEQGLIPFDICDRTYLLSPQDYKQMSHDLLMCFTYENNYKYKAKLTPVQYRKKDNPLDVVFQFYRCYTDLVNIDQYIKEYEFLGPEFLHIDTTIFDFCETEPGFLLSPQEFSDFINTTIPDSILNDELEIKGRIYIKFVIESDSSGSQFEVIRGMNSTYDAYALDLIKGMAPFKPGTMRGVAVRSRYIIPISFSVK